MSWLTVCVLGLDSHHLIYNLYGSVSMYFQAQLACVSMQEALNIPKLGLSQGLKIADKNGLVCDGFYVELNGQLCHLYVLGC